MAPAGDFVQQQFGRIPYVALLGRGIWLDGKLAGNMWTTIMMENISTGAHRATTSSIAALYPYDSMSLAFNAN